MDSQDEYFYNEFMGLSSSDDDERDETIIMMSVVEETENAEEQ
jgi:hypothetical protein